MTLFILVILIPLSYWCLQARWCFPDGSVSLNDSVKRRAFEDLATGRNTKQEVIAARTRIPAALHAAGRADVQTGGPRGWPGQDVGGSHRWVDIDYESGEGDETFAYDVLTQGPVVGFGFRF